MNFFFRFGRPLGINREKKKAKQKCQSVRESICKGGNTQLPTSGGPKYASCNLFLSGDDDLQTGSISCLNAMHLRLHLSSVSISEVLSDQDNEICQPVEHEMNNNLAQESVSENPVINCGLTFQKLCEGPSRRLDILPDPKVSYEPNTDQPIGANQNHEQTCHGKLVGGSRKSTAVDDVVELSIAASEAVVISEMVSSSLQFESFSDAAILEIALRMKQARNECVFETAHSISTVNPDDVDQLSDLDEDSMANAYEDVGITVQQIGETSYCLFSSRKSFNSTHGSDTKKHQILKSNSSYTSNILAGDCGDKREALPKELKGEDTSKIARTCSVFDRTLRSSSLHLGTQHQLQTKALDNLPPDYSLPCLKYQPQEHEQKLNVIDALPAIWMGSMENGCTQKDGKVSEPSNASIKKSLKLFTMETSFISESMDVMDQHVSQLNPAVQLEIVSSSNTVLQSSSLGIHKVKEHNHEAPFSQDHSRSLSLADPLSSVVPCSISSGVSVAHDSELAIDGIEKSNYPSTVLCSNYLDGNDSMQGNSMLQKVFLENREFILSETRVEYPSVPIRKQLNSLRPYSLGTDNQENTEKSSSLCKQLLLHGICGVAVNEFFEKNLECSSDKNDIELSRKCLDANHPHNKQILEENKIGVASLALWGTKNDDTQTPVYQHKDACSPPIVNYMKHHYQASKITLGGENLESLKRSFTSDIWKCRSNESTKKTSCWDEATNVSYTPGKSNLHLFPADGKPRKKRVRFQEASYNMNLPKSFSLQSKCLAHCSCSGSAKSSTLLYNSEPGLVHKYNYFNNGAVEKNGTILLGLDFLLTGFSNHKVKELEKLIRRHGGYVLPNIPSNFPYLRGDLISYAHRKLPVVLSPKKVHTTKFLYGCAVNTLMLNDHWLFDTIQSGATLPPRKYMIRPITSTKGNKLLIGESFCLSNSMPIFRKLGMMVHGKEIFCAKFMKIVKHGGGQVFKSLQRLLLSLKNGTNTLGIILVNNEGSVSRHLKHCALENDIPTVPASWIINSLLSGKLLPFKRERYASLHRIKMPSFHPVQIDEGLSQEI